MWADMVEAAKTSNYSSPRLTAHAAGQALQLLYGGLRSASQDGIVTVGKPTFSPQVTAVTPTANPVAVTIVDCMDSSQWREFVASTGKPKDDQPGGKHRSTATVGLLQSTWKVTQLHVEGVGTCS